MLEIREAMYRGKPASVFLMAAGGEAPSESLVALRTRMRDRFRCGDSPRPGHTPLVGEIAFIRTGPSENPAALVTLAHELGSLFNVICVQAGADDYVAAVVNESSPCGCALGDRIPAAEVKEHPDPWSKA